MRQISEEELRQWAHDYANTKGGAYFGDAFKHFMAGMKHIIAQITPDVSQNDREMFNDLFEALQQRVFHSTDTETRMAIDEFIRTYPIMLEFHNIEWYYKNM